LPLAICTWLALTPAPPDAIAHVSDVIQHAGAFVYLTVAARLAFPARAWWTVAAGMLAYGALLEVLQGLGGTRFAEWRDLAVDGVGIALGLGVHYLIGARLRRMLGRRLGGWFR